jgi:negative regulator of replication initiation
MRTYTVELDEDVYNYLKNKAEPFVDKTPSDVLRRELRLKSNPLAVHGQRTVNNWGISEVPAGTPKALEQILQVVHAIRKGSQNRSAATQIVARKYGIAEQTVIDKYGRQLGLTARQFDKLLEQPDLKDLKQLLNRKFPDNKVLVNELT